MTLESKIFHFQKTGYEIAKRYWFEILSVVVVAIISLYGTVIAREHTLGEGTLTYPSFAAFSLCFVLTSYFLNRQNVKFFDRVLYSLAAMASGIVLSEIVYHFALGIPSFQDFLHYELFFFGNQSANGYFSLNWYLIILIVPLIGLRYTTWNKILIGIIVFLGLAILVWIAGGYVHSHEMLFNSFAKMTAVIPALVFNKEEHPNSK